MDVKDILDEQNIDYKIKGHDYIIECLNPSHEDTNPSMRVDITTGIFNCFSCGSKGNLFTKFNKIVNMLNIRQTNILEKIKQLKIPNLALPEDADQFSHEFRGISIKTLQNFEAFTSEKDWEGRIVFPIKNYKNNIVAFIGRFTHSNLDPKYMVLPHGSMLPLYPPAVNINSNSIVLVEGIFDLLNLYDKGITNVVTGFGLVKSKKSNNVSTIHDRFAPYKIIGVNKIFILYDGDKPGKDAARFLERDLSDYISVEVLNLPDGVDPGSLTQKQVDKLKDVIK